MSPTNSHTPSRPASSTYAGIFLISVAALLLQITFIRIFSASIWYHFAFLVVSIALFGFGASGVALGFIDPLRDSRNRWLSAGLFALTAVGAYFGTRAIPFSPFRILQDPIQILYFALYDVLLLVPFFFAGLTVATILRSHPERAGRLYAFDLVGAAVGVGVVFVTLPAIGAPGAVAMAAAIGGLAAAVMATGVWRLVWGTAAAGLAIAAVLPGVIPDIRLDESKLVRDEIGKYNGTLAFSAWNALSRIDVVERTWENPVIYIDAAAATPITPMRTTAEARADIASTAFRVSDGPRVLIIGLGGGVDVQNAIAMGAASVTAVEINPIIIGLVTNRYAEQVGRVFERPDVSIVRDEGRSYLQRMDERVDVIQITLIDTWAASASGAYSLSENYLYTTEAFETYLDRLSDDGMLSMTRWYYEVPRLAVLARAALERRGVASPGEHVAVVRSGLLALLLVKSTPFIGTDLEVIDEAVADLGAELLYDPLSPRNETFYDDLFAEARAEEALEDSQLNLRATTDESPFFFQMARWDRINFRDLGRYSGENVLEPLTIPAGQAALLAALLIGVLLSAVMLIISLKRGGGGDPSWLVYFLAIGLAFIIVEVVLIQRLTLFLGHPTYAVTSVLFSILVFSGAGAAWSDRKGPASVVPVVTWGLPASLLLIAFAAPPLLGMWMGLPLALRLIVAAFVIAPSAIMMGTLLPMGIRSVGERGVPMGWAANGCASVIGSVLAVLIAMVWSYKIALLAAGAIYMLAIVVLRRKIA